MNIFRPLLALLQTTAFCSPLAAQSYDEASSAYTAAIKRLSSLDRADDALRRWLATNAANVNLDGSQVTQIKELLAGWRAYTVMECNLVGSITGGNASSKAAYSSLCLEKRYGVRTQVVRVAIQCLEKVRTKSDDDRLFASTCLEPLTPLRAELDYSG